MIEIGQEYLHDPKNDVIGDCFRASVASVLELDIDDIPHFMDLYRGDGAWYPQFNRWLRKKHDLVYMDFPCSEDMPKFMEENIGSHVILTGTSPRFPDELHAVVGFNTEIIWDPHPDNTGIQDIQFIGVFVKVLR